MRAEHGDEMGGGGVGVTGCEGGKRWGVGAKVEEWQHDARRRRYLLSPAYHPALEATRVIPTQPATSLEAYLL